MMVLAWLSVALAWTEIGPERGHVVDVAVGPETVSVATRVGVVSAPVGGGVWTRDARFPPDVRTLEIGADGVAWAAPPGQLWRVGAITERVATFDGGVVDLAVVDGAALALVRGSRGSVVRVEGGTVTEVLGGVDPWRVLVVDDTVWLGTADKGLWRSTDGGKSFKQAISSGSVSALGTWKGDLLVAFADGRVLDADSEDVLLQLDGGWVSSIAAVGEGALFTVDSPAGRYGPLCRFDGETCTDLPPNTLGEDPGLERLTGAWALPGGQAMVGTFRRGPLRSDGSTLQPDRSGFRATVSGGAAGRGEVMLAAMGSGVYLSPDGQTWKPMHGGDGPVTDAVSVSIIPGGYAVVDFEGIALYRDGRWTRIPGVEIPGVPRRNGLEDAGVDAQGRLWAVDGRGQLRLREQGKWVDCAQRGLRLDGLGETLVLAGGEGFAKPGDCASPWPLAFPELPSQPPAVPSRAEAGWVVGGGKVWRQGKEVAELKGKTLALSASADEALVLMDDGVVRRCTAKGCAAVDLPLTSAAVALGTLADGRVWVAESKGTVLVEGAGGAVSPWSRVSAQIPPMDLARIYTPPWGREGQAGAPPPGAGPQPGVPSRGPGGVANAPGTSAPEPKGGCQSAPAAGGLWPLVLLWLRRSRVR